MSFKSTWMFRIRKKKNPWWHFTTEASFCQLMDHIQICVGGCSAGLDVQMGQLGPDAWGQMGQVDQMGAQCK